MDQAQNTLRDAVAENFDAVIPGVPEGATEAPKEAEGVKADAIIGETAEQKAERLRDEKGRFAKSDSTAVPATAATPEPKPSAQAALEPAPAVEPAKPAVQRPSSWKKDYWEAFDKLASENPTVAQYILQREREAAQGVSAYKAEWDRAKPLIQAIEPYRELFQREGLDPGKQFQTYAEIHKGLAYGSEDQKLALVLRLAQGLQGANRKAVRSAERADVFQPEHSTCGPTAAEAIGLRPAGDRANGAGSYPARAHRFRDRQHVAGHAEVSAFRGCTRDDGSTP